MRRSVLTVVASFVLAMSVPHSATAQEMQGPASPVGASEYRPNVAYGRDSFEVMDLCLPSGSHGVHPGVILIHGGGWVAGGKVALKNVCMELANQGFVAASINYRLAREAPWPAQLLDSQFALRWMRRHAGELSLAPDKICAWGNSAGGQLAAYLGLRETFVASPGGGSDASPEVQCVVANSGVYDLTSMNRRFVDNLAGPLFGGVTIAQDPGLYRSASPLFAVTPKAAPMLLIHGRNDRLVAPKQASDMLDALKSKGVSANLIMNDGGHVGNGLSPEEQKAVVNEGIAFVRENLKR